MVGFWWVIGGPAFWGVSPSCLQRVRGGFLGVVGFAGSEHGVDDVASFPGDADDGGVVVFASVAESFVEAGGGGVVADGDER